ncbi:hypothetical protein BJ170DRAFT_592415 [Xylariales sp. AK1849]|nr:hypothetical protein BJ170DRAFT_592415 [Xylariales sp. AK1849]
MITFTPNCTLPTTTPVYVSGVTIRSTLNIVWSCLSILILCSWSILHLNVPGQFKPQTSRQRLARKAWLLFRKIKWMLLTLVAPELMLGNAVLSFRSARLNTPLFERFAAQDGVPWSRAHTLLADMGGFAVMFEQDDGAEEEGGKERLRRDEDLESLKRPRSRFEPRGSSLRRPETVLILEQFSPFEVDVGERSSRGAGKCENRLHQVDDGKAAGAKDTIYHDNTGLDEQGTVGLNGTGLGKPVNTDQERERFHRQVEAASRRYGPLSWRPLGTHTQYGRQILADTAVLESYTQDQRQSLFCLEGDVWFLTAAQLYHVRKCGIVGRLPQITEDEIADKSKGDLLVKVGALVQVIWLFVQVVARVVLHNAASPLEIMTLAFAACAFITYILLLEHPQGVQVPTYLPAQRSPSKEEMDEIARLYPQQYFPNPHQDNAIPNDSWHRAYNDPQATDIHAYGLFSAASSLGSLIFGGIHLFAWDFSFPSAVEQLLWRICSLITAVNPLIIAVAVALIFKTFQRLGGFSLWMLPVLVLTALLYPMLVLARVFLLVEAFRSLYFLPPDAYLGTWVVNAPHIG